MKRALWVLAVLGLSGSVGLAQTETKKAGAKEAHLGIAVAAVPEALSSHLPGTLAKGQGILIVEVAKDSPAAKAGLQVNDILLTLDDQKLHSPEQLVKMVRADKPGHEAALTYLRGGKTMHAKATLGEAEPTTRENQQSFRVVPDESAGKAPKGAQGKNSPGFWESFDEMRLTRTGDKKWRAIIDYRTKDGKKEERTFTGSREEIRKAIQAEKDLPTNERTHLLHALNLDDPMFDFYFGPTIFWDHR